MDKKNNNKCDVCGKAILAMVYKGTGVCSENCRKQRDNDLREAQQVF